MDEKEQLAIEELSNGRIDVKAFMIMLKITTRTSDNFYKICRYFYGNNINGNNILDMYKQYNNNINNFLQFIISQDNFDS